VIQRKVLITGSEQLNPMTLGQDRLEDVMRRHLLDRFGVSVELGTELVHLEQSDDIVTASLEKHTAGSNDVEKECVQFAYLVGANGGKSGSYLDYCYIVTGSMMTAAVGNVRKLLGANFTGVTRTEEWLLYGDVEIKGLDHDVR
jgi:hypothetical protein